MHRPSWDISLLKRFKQSFHSLWLLKKYFTPLSIKLGHKEQHLEMHTFWPKELISLYCRHDTGRLYITVVYFTNSNFSDSIYWKTVTIFWSCEWISLYCRQDTGRLLYNSWHISLLQIFLITFTEEL